MELADLFVCLFVRSFVCLLGSFGLFGLFGAFGFLGLFVWFAWFIWLLWFVWFGCFVWNDHEGGRSTLGCAAAARSIAGS